MKSNLFIDDRLERYWTMLTSTQKDEQVILWDKEHEKFLWKNHDRTINSICCNTTYKFSNQSWYNFLKGIKKRIK